MEKKLFEKFYKEHVDAVFRFVLYKVQDRMTAEDLVSDIFMKALSNFDSFDESRGKKAWIMTIAKHTIANHWRDRKVSERLDGESADGEEEWVHKGVIKQSKVADRDQNIKWQLSSFLAQLSEPDREIVTLHYLAGYSYSEIAEMMGSTEGAVKVAAHRVLKKLKKLEQ